MENLERTERIINLWKENDVEYIDFEFNCGGDSMGDTTLNIYDTKGDLVNNDELENYFDNEVYHNVNFYEASDGHYIGESGNVHISLNDDETDFEYSKESESEWCEHTPFTETINLTDEEVDFVDKYVSDINGNMSEGDYNINYKVDFIKTDELVEVEEKLMNNIQNYFENYEPDLDNMSEWHTMEIDVTTLDTKNKTIEIEMSFEHYVYQPNED
jgi:hypothetical protein